jgi:hypothetical protein
MLSNEMFKVVYNNCYGGFDLSAEGLAEYNRQTSKNITIPDYINREDTVLITMVETMDPKKINSKNSKLKITEFDKKFKSFLSWDDYDGKESVKIDYNKYIVHTVEFIINKDISDDEKIKIISNLYTDLENVKCLKCNAYMCMHIRPIRI